MNPVARRRWSIAFVPLVVGLLVLGSATTGAADSARRHLRLVKSAPMADSVLTRSPTAIKLWFSEKVELGVTRVRLEGTDARRVTLSPLASEDDKGVPVVVAGVPTALADGAYTVQWSTASKDGHVVKGTIAFTVRTR